MTNCGKPGLRLAHAVRQRPRSPRRPSQEFRTTIVLDGLPDASELDGYAATRLEMREARREHAERTPVVDHDRPRRSRASARSVWRRDGRLSEQARQSTRTRGGSGALE
ncbi:MAG: hypothetical protein WKF84_30150 [Pyrinomonadaceae bacterium]